MRLIRISAIWCSACLIMRPRVDKILENYPGIESIEYDFDMDEDIVNNYNVKDKLPVFILEEDNEIRRIVGEKTIDELNIFLEGSI